MTVSTREPNDVQQAGIDLLRERCSFVRYEVTDAGDVDVTYQLLVACPGKTRGGDRCVTRRVRITAAGALA